MSGIELTEIQDVWTVSIDRPERRNALGRQQLHEFDSALDRIATATREGGTRCVVLEGRGGHFCSGADLKELEDLEFTVHLRSVLDRIEAIPVPVIAAIDGSCMGLGVQLALASDIRIATPEAQFAIPIAKLGLLVDQWTIRRATALLGEAAVRYLTLTGSVMPASDAHRLGFVSELAPLSRAHDLAQAVRRLAPLTLAGVKRGLNRLGRCDLDADGWDPDYRRDFVAAWESTDFEEGRRAFTERRPPEFRSWSDLG